MHFLKLLRLSSALARDAVVVRRPIARQLIYFDKAFHSQKNLGALTHIEDVINEGEVLKSSNASLVAKTKIGALEVVVKRYNTHSIWSGIKQWFKVSPGYNAWFYAHWLIANNIPTPKPLAVVEQKIGLIRKRSYYIYSYLNFELLSDVLINKPIDSPEFKGLEERIVNMFKALYKVKTHHDNFKIANFLVHQGEIYMIDLDYVSFSMFRPVAKRNFRKDKNDFLDNFKDYPEKQKYFAKALSFIS
jgi:hypothetical protein